MSTMTSPLGVIDAGILPDMATTKSVNGTPRPGAKNTPAPAAPRKRLNLHGAALLRPLIYLGAFAVASIGGVQAVAPRLHLPLLLALPFWLFIECCGVLFMAMAQQMLIKGRRNLAAVSAALSAAIAAGVAWLNFIGHPGNPWLGSIFGAASVAAYIVFVITTVDAAMDAALIGKRATYRFPLTTRLRHIRSGKVRVAEQIMARNPSMTPVAALLAAEDHPVVLRCIRERMLKEIIGYDSEGKPRRRTPAEVDLIILALQPHTLVSMFAELMQPIREATVEMAVADLAPRTVAPRRPAPAASASAPARRPGRATTKTVKGGAERRPWAETARMADEIRSANPGITEQAVADKLGITVTYLNNVKRKAAAAAGDTPKEHTAS